MTENVQTHTAEDLEALALVKTIEESIARLREIAQDIYSVRYSETIDIEIRPKSDDDRVLVGCKKRGWTTLNYVNEGLIVDVFPAFGIDPMHSVVIYNEDLQDEDEAEKGVQQENPSNG